MIRSTISKIKTSAACFYLESGKQGTILLEIAVALSIIGMFSSFFITKITVVNKIVRAQATKNNIEIVTFALASFLSNNNRLPRPSVSGDGLEGNLSDEQNLSNFVGKIPFRTLGISERSSMDGNGRPLIYIVEQNLTSNFSGIYESPTVDIVDSFCNCGINTNIEVKNITNLENGIIAFVIDTEDNRPDILQEKIIVSSSINTYWISRDTLLMKYLKNCPCKIERRSINDQQSFNSEDLPF